MRVIDQFHDPTLGVLANLVADRPKIAMLVGDVEVNPEELDSLPASAFAWQEKRAFPIFSREHTIMSRVYRDNTSDVPPYVDKTLKEACDVYGIDESVFTREKHAAAVDNPEDYLLPDMKRLRVTSAEHVKVAEQKLLDGYQKLSVEHRAMACKNLIEKAAQYNVALHPLMRKLAGFTVTSTQGLKDWIEARKEASTAPEYKDAFQKLADGLKGQPAELHDRPSLIKMAEVITELDKKAGLQRYYGKKLPDPLQTVFNTEKTAGFGVDLGGKFMPVERLAAYPSSFFSDILGDDLVREASDGQGGLDPHHLAEVLETLPCDMKNLLARHMG